MARLQPVEPAPRLPALPGAQTRSAVAAAAAAERLLSGSEGGLPVQGPSAVAVPSPIAPHFEVSDILSPDPPSNPQRAPERLTVEERSRKQRCWVGGGTKFVAQDLSVHGFP